MTALSHTACVRCRRIFSTSGDVPLYFVEDLDPAFKGLRGFVCAPCLDRLMALKSGLIAGLLFYRPTP